MFSIHLASVKKNIGEIAPETDNFGKLQFDFLRRVLSEPSDLIFTINNFKPQVVSI